MSNFTDTYIKALKTKQTRYEEYEGGGFGIRVASTGVKTWIYQVRFQSILTQEADVAFLWVID